MCGALSEAVASDTICHATMTRFISTAAIIVLLGSRIIGQQAPPVRPGPAVRVPALVTFVAPEYPGWARFLRSQTVVTLDLVVGRDGRVQEVVVLAPPAPAPPPSSSRAAPLLVDPGSLAQFRDSVLKAARLWTFDPSSIASPTVTVPIRVRFEMLPAPLPTSFFADEASQPPVAVPADFEVVYSYGVYGCRLETRAAEFRMSGRLHSPYSPAVVPVTLTTTQRETIYREMMRVGFFEYGSIPVDYRRVPPSPPADARFETSATGIDVFVRAVPEIGTVVQPSVRHTIEAWRGGTSKSVTWDDQYVGPALSREIEGIRLVIATLQRVLQEHDAIRLLGPPITDMCRAPQ